MSSPRVRLLAAVGLGALSVAGTAYAWPGLAMRQIVAERQVAVAQPAADSTATAEAKQPETQVVVMPSNAEPPVLRDPSSFVRVHITPAAPADAQPADADAPARFSPPALAEATPAESSGTNGLIPVPDNARAGDPAFVDVPEDETDADYGYYDAPAYGAYGTVFYNRPYLIGGWAPGHFRPHPTPHSGRPRHDPRDLPAFGSDDLHRRAELQFSQAATAAPGVARTEAGFARAQLQFSRAAMAPGAQRQGDGLRHEVVRPAPRPQR